ncbi:unnamed protein product [Prunus armeniaca]
MGPPDYSSRRKTHACSPASAFRLRNFILRDHISGGIFWESFDYPCDTFLPKMMIGFDKGGA